MSTPFFEDEKDEKEWLYEQNKKRKITQKQLAEITKQSQATVSKKIKEVEIFKEAEKQGEKKTKEELINRLITETARFNSNNQTDIYHSGPNKNETIDIQRQHNNLDADENYNPTATV